MAVYRFRDVRGFEAAVGQGPEFARFTLTPALAAEWLGMSSNTLTALIGSGGVDAVMTDDGHTFLDADALSACDAPPRSGVSAPSVGSLIIPT